MKDMKHQFGTIKTNIIQLSRYAYIFLWLYTAIYKLMDFGAYKWALFNQPLPHFVVVGLLFLLPISEIIGAILLYFHKSMIYGLILSSILMGAFTIYIANILLGSFKRIPCACAGIFEHVGWATHLYFNIVFLLLGIISLIFTYQERRRMNYTI